MVDLETLLDERKNTHGDFTDHAACTQSLKVVAKNWPNWVELSPVQKEAIEMILHKLGRIMTGNPDHKDHWDDIAGYARLVSQRIEP